MGVLSLSTEDSNNNRTSDQILCSYSRVNFELRDSSFDLYRNHQLLTKVLQKSPSPDSLCVTLSTLFPARQFRLQVGVKLENFKERRVVCDDDQYIWVCIERLERLKREVGSHGIRFHHWGRFIKRGGSKVTLGIGRRPVDGLKDGAGA